MKDKEIRYTRILCGRCQLRLASSTVRPSHIVELTGEFDDVRRLRPSHRDAALAASRMGLRPVDPCCPSPAWAG